MFQQEHNYSKQIMHLRVTVHIKNLQCVFLIQQHGPINHPLRHGASKNITTSVSCNFILPASVFNRQVENRLFQL